MKSARLVVLAIAIGAAVLALIVGMKVLRKPAPKQQVVQQERVDLSEVLVLSNPVELGTTLKSSNLRWQKWPKDAVAPSFITRGSNPDAIEEYIGAVARSNFAEGEPINKNKLIKAGSGGYMSAVLPEGKRAISISIREESGAGGFILPNDRVDVIMTRSVSDGSTGNNNAFTSQRILSNIRVLAIGDIFGEEDKEKRAEGKTATLEVDQKQAEALALAERVGELSLALRSLADSDPNKNKEEEDSYGEQVIKIMKFGIATQVGAGQ